MIILDTQGTFDHKTASAEYTAFFALSVLVSSVQMYNLKDEINMDHLKALQVLKMLKLWYHEKCSCFQGTAKCSRTVQANNPSRN